MVIKVYQCFSMFKIIIFFSTTFLTKWHTVIGQYLSYTIPLNIIFSEKIFKYEMDKFGSHCIHKWHQSIIKGLKIFDRCKLFFCHYDKKMSKLLVFYVQRCFVHSIWWFHFHCIWYSKENYPVVTFLCFF